MKDRKEVQCVVIDDIDTGMSDRITPELRGLLPYMQVSTAVTPRDIAGDCLKAMRKGNRYG